MKQCPSLYSYQALMHAFTMFAEADGPSGCITYEALKQALVRIYVSHDFLILKDCHNTQHMHR